MFRKLTMYEKAAIASMKDRDVQPVSISVITIKDGVVNENILFNGPRQKTVDAAQKRYLKECKKLGYKQDKFGATDEDLLNEGYFSIMNAAVCISWPEMMDIGARRAKKSKE